MPLHAPQGAAGACTGPLRRGVELARAVTTRRGADIERSRLALRTIPSDQRRAIAGLVEETWEAEGV